MMYILKAITKYQGYIERIKEYIDIDNKRDFILTKL